jgi:eukaryotic-like serine/threonine-protein kinase
MADMASPEPPSSSRPRVIAGRYRLEHVLGSGSMGTVWTAYDEFLHRQVAVKEVLLPPGIPAAEADALRERTLREARAIAVLSHPNVVTLHDIARQDGEPFVVMELVPSRSLAEVVRQRGPLSTEQAAAVADAVAAALDAAHRAGITHRDVKPGNVLVGNSGQLKLNDFGIARNVAETTMTSTGIMLGSPAYIAPEVASGQAVTPAADLWSLGATLFAVLEGRPPYDADDDPLATVTEVVHGEVPKATNADVLEPIISGLMVKDPSARMSLADVRRHLRPLLPDPAVVLFPVPETNATPPPPPPPHQCADALSKAFAPPKPPDTPLANDPGPLPFMVFQPAPAPKPARRRRGKVATAVLALVAAAVVLVALVAGFVVTRILGGQPLIPPTVAVAGTVPPSTSIPRVSTTPVRATAALSTGAGSSGGDFTLDVPANYQQFELTRPAVGSLPSSAQVYFISKDGGTQLSVQRFPKFTGLATYIATVSNKPSFQVSAEGLPTGFDSGKQVDYNTPDPKSPSYNDTAVLVHGADLWVVTVTVSLDALPAGKALYNQIVPRFRVIN